MIFYFIPPVDGWERKAGRNGVLVFLCLAILIVVLPVCKYIIQPFLSHVFRKTYNSMEGKVV